MRLKTTALPLACALFLLTAFGSANAETADRSKPIEINADNFQGDEVQQVAIYTGRVEVHQGTLEILGDKLTVTISPEGYRTITVTGNPVRMKERRDPQTPGVEEWVHASSLTAVYEEQKDVITLTELAKLARSENGLVKDSSAGEKIVYNLRTARSRVEGAVVEGKRNRVSTVLAPRKQGNQAAPAPSTGATAPMQGTTRLGQ
jgi:lipopolysaccharide export system protein LptA